MKPLAKPAIDVVRANRVKIIPERFTNEYMHWMENIRDWCISRQLWWGHRIPVWYCEVCGAQRAPSREDPMRDPESCENCGATRLQQDEDVLDTWFSSGLWSHSTLGWPDDTEDLRYFYPPPVMQMGYDILFFWAARMIALALYNTGQIPFRHLYLHGLIRDAQGRKMTKSLGNVVDPLEAADKYGADALRFTLATGGAAGNDFQLHDEKLEAGRNFANKIWNAGRFAVQSIGEEKVRLPQDCRTVEHRRDWPLEDRWITSRVLATARQANKLLGEFQINEAAGILREFFWSEFADWYVEMAKVRLKAGDRSPLPVLAYVLQSSLRLLHPIMPFVTEAVWQYLRSVVEDLERDSIVIAAYPRGEGELDTQAEERIQVVKDVIRAIRNIRAERGVDPARFVEAYVAADGARPVLEAARPVVETLARVRPLHLVTGSESIPSTGVASAVLTEAQVVLPLAALIDVDAERRRLTSQLQEAEAEARRLEAKLANEQFREKAPPEVVAREQERLAGARTRLDGLRDRLAELG